MAIKKKPGRKSNIEKQLEHLQNGLDKALSEVADLRRERNAAEAKAIFFEDQLAQKMAEIPASDETIIPGKFGGATGIAIRTAETPDSFRALVTIRFGFSPEKIAFNFGNYGGSSGPTIQGGGDPFPDPPCP